MEFIALSDPGCGRFLKEELQEHNLSGEGDDIVSGTCTIKESCSFAYRSLVATRVMVSLGTLGGDVDNKNLLGETFKVESEEELIDPVADWLIKAGMKVDLDRPDTVVIAVKRGEDILSGIDLCGHMEKREYRTMLSNRSLRATIAASAARFAGIRPEHTVVDPIADDGTLAIEASLMRNGISPRKFLKTLPFERFQDRPEDTQKEAPPVLAFVDQLRELKAVRMNSKLASCPVESTRLPLKWLHTKCEDVDRILTYPHCSGRIMPEKKARASIRELFRQAEEVLASDGTMTCVTTKPEELLEETAFHLEERLDARMGNQPVSFLKFTSPR